MMNLNPRAPSRGLAVGSSEGFRGATISRPLCCSLRVHARSAAAARLVAPLDSGPSLRRLSGWTDFADTLADLRRPAQQKQPANEMPAARNTSTAADREASGRYDEREAIFNGLKREPAYRIEVKPLCDH